MKCRYCGNPISPEDKKCPSCLWEGDDLAIPDDAEVKQEENTENTQNEAQFEQSEQAAQTEQTENTGNTENTQGEQPKSDPFFDPQPEINNIVPGLTKKEFFDFYIPEKIRLNAVWAVYLLFFSAIANCFSALSNFYSGIICSVVCLALAIAIKKTLNIGPAIAACIFTILLTGVNFLVYDTLSGWVAVIASIYCCSSLSKFNSMWAIYTATAKIPLLDPMDKARAEKRRSKKHKNIGWIIYYVILGLCIVGVVANYAVSLTYVSKFTKGELDGKHYTNEFYALDITFDSDWTVLEGEDLAKMNDEVYWVADPSATDTQYIVYSYGAKDEMVLIESYFMNTLIYSGSDVADDYELNFGLEADTADRLDDVEYNGKVYEVVYLTYELTETGETAYEKYFVRTEGSFCVTIFVAAYSEADLEAACAMVFGSKAE